MKKLLIISFGVLFFSAAVTAQPEHPAPMGQAIAKHLKLTPDQETKFNDMRAQNQKDMVDIRSNIEKNRIELKRMVDGGKIDEAKLLQLTDANSKLQADMKHQATSHWLNVYKMLNDEQKAIWVKHLSMFADGMKMRAKFRHGVRNFMMNRRGQGREGMNRPGMGHKGMDQQKEKESK